MGCTSSSDAAKPGAPPPAAKPATGQPASSKKMSSKGLIEITYIGNWAPAKGEPYGLVDPIRQMLEYSNIEYKFNGLQL